MRLAPAVDYSLVRATDAVLLNRVANDPSVRPWLEGSGPLDLGPVVADPNNIALINEHGGFVFVQHEPGIYEVHTQLLPSGRGRRMREAAAEAMRIMFTRSDCMELVTRAADDHKAALFGARLVGFSYRFRRDAAWTRSDGTTTGAQYFGLTLDGWMRRDETLAGWGHYFHEQLEAAKKAAGSELPTHPDDDTHDRAAGAALLMCEAGWPHKAVATYNRWARLAGYVPISIKPVWHVDVVDAVFRADTMEIVECR